jgi:probable F420-dependent oxidoreductase
MQLGVTFPQNEIGTDPAAIRDYVQATDNLGYKHIVIYDHVLGAGPSHGPSYSRQMFHEPFVLFGYLAALTNLELVTDVIILPQRQTALVAKQAAEIDILTGGKFRLGIGVGWNPVEYEGLGMNFNTRGRVIEEQIEVLRRLWSEEFVTFKGNYHTLTEAGLNPLPTRRNIPIWMGGHSDKTLRRVALMADGWLPLGQPDAEKRELLERLRLYADEAGRNFASIGVEAVINAADGDFDEWLRHTEGWRALGATHVSLNTMGIGYKVVDQHIDAIRRYKEALKD